MNIIYKVAGEDYMKILNFLSNIFITSLIFLFVSCGEEKDGSSSACNYDSCGHCPSAQTGIKICEIVASPTESESVTLKNYDQPDQDLLGWYLRDANGLSNGNGQENLTGIIENGMKETFDALNFAVNDSNETIVLFDDQGDEVDRKGN